MILIVCLFRILSRKIAIHSLLVTAMLCSCWVCRMLSVPISDPLMPCRLTASAVAGPDTAAGKDRGKPPQELAAISEKLTTALAEAAKNAQAGLQLRAQASQERQQLQQRCGKLQAQLQHAARSQPSAAIHAVSTAEPEALRAARSVQHTKSYAPHTLASPHAVLPTLSAIIAAQPEHPHAKWGRLQLSQHEPAPRAGISCAAADTMLALANSAAAPRISTVIQSGQLRAAARTLISCASI